LTESEFYGKYLSKIHDSDFGFFAENAAIGIFEVLQKFDITEGHLVDLGCGSGILAKYFISKGYSVTGIDQSQEMISIAKKKTENAHFMLGSFYSMNIPSCNVVLSTGECLNYYNKMTTRSQPKKLFQQIYSAISSQGIFIFDFAMPGRVESSNKKKWRRDNWEMKVEHKEDKKSNYLTRKIFLKINTKKGEFQKQETHRLKLYKKEELESLLVGAGFSPKFVSGYGSYNFPFHKGYGGFLARKK